MALTEALRFLITSDSAQARTDLAKLNQQTTATTSGLDKLKGSFAAGLGVGAGVSVFDTALNGLSQVGRFALAQASAAIDASSRLQQSQGAVKAIFGESAAIVERYGRSAADAVGLSNSAFQQQAALLGGLLQGLGQTRSESAKTSRDLIQLGADLAATYGGTTADAVDRISAALRGEFDSIQRYIPAIKAAAVEQKALEMGLASSTSALTEQQKATATLALIFEGTRSVQGAFGRESDTLAGQQQRLNAELENLRAELGEALLPAMTELTEAARGVLPVIQILGATATETGKAFVVGAKYVRQFVDPLVQAQQVLNPFISIAAKAVDVVDDLAGGDNSAFYDAVEASLDLRDAIEAGSISLEEARTQLDALPPAARSMAEASYKAALANEDLKDKTDALSPSLDTLNKQVAGLSDSMFGAERAQSAFFKTTEASGGAAGRTASQVAKAQRTVENATRSLAEAQESLQEAEVARFLTSLGASSDEITLAQIAERDSTRSLADAKRDLIDAQERLRELREGDAASLLDAEAANIEAQRRLVDAERGGDAVELLRARSDLIRTEEALNDARNPATADKLAQAEQDVAAAQDAVTKAEIDAKRSREELNDVINRGRDGSKELAEANKAVEAAQRRVEDAEWALVDATDALIGPVSGLAGATKDANQKFLEGEAAADAWLKKLIAGKVTPEEFAAAIKTVRDRLGDVADQAGKTKELDDYLTKMESIYKRIKDIDSAAAGAKVTLGQIPGFVGSSGGIGASAGASPQTIELKVDGKTFGTVVVNSLIAWNNDNGSIPIRVR